MDYFLHAECGYTWGTTVQGLYPSEKIRLWNGWLIWQSAVKGGGKSQQSGPTSGKSKTPGGKSGIEQLSAGDKKLLRELNRRNAQQSPSSSSGATHQSPSSDVSQF